MPFAPKFQAQVNFPTYLNTYLFLKESHHWSKERLERYQLHSIKKLVHHAYKNVPYYKKLFDECNIQPTNINSLADFQHIPFLTKNLVRQNRDNLKARNYPAHTFDSYYTGGSTGQPLQFFIEKGVYFAIMRAYGTIQNEWTNRHFFDKSLVIIGQRDLFKTTRFGRTLSISSFNINDPDIPLILQKIHALQPKYILSYPSSLTKLTTYMRDHNIPSIQSVKSIVCIAEVLYPWQRALIEETFHCRVYEHYCQRESVAFGLTCQYTNYFHMFPQFGYVELIGKDGQHIQNEDEVGEVVGTSLVNHVFPFIRYKLGDLGVYTNQQCPCGCHYPLLKKIEGRTQEIALSKTHQPFSLTGLYDFVAKSTQHIKECQFYQDTAGTLLLNIVKTHEFTEKDHHTIQKNFQNLFGDRMDLTIQCVDHIPLTPSGKYRFFIQKIPIEYIQY